MTRSTLPRPRAGTRRAALLPASCLLPLLLLLSGSPPASAARTVRYNEVTVAGGDLAAAFQEALRTALVRATGRRDADQDPAFAELLADPRRYVQLYRPAAGGGYVITFDPTALDRAITAAQRTLWARERPVVLLALAEAPPAAEAAALRRTLEDAGAQRGLPLQFADAASGATLAAATAGAALAAARREGADALLAGRAGGDGVWTWTLHAPGGTETFAGGATAGVQGAADALARASDAVMTQIELEAVVQVGHVRSLKDYATVTRLIVAAPGVRSVTPVEVGGELVVFRVVARGGADGLATGLASSAALRPAAGGSTPGRIAFDYQP